MLANKLDHTADKNETTAVADANRIMNGEG